MWNILTFWHDRKKLIDLAEEYVQRQVLVFAALNPDILLAEKMIRTSNGARTVSLTMFLIQA